MCQARSARVSLVSASGSWTATAGFMAAQYRAPKPTRAGWSLAIWRSGPSLGIEREWVLLQLGRAGGVGYGDDAMHDGMNAADVGIVPGCEAGNGKGAVWQNHAGIKGARLPVFQTTLMGNGVFSRSGIVPPNRHLAGDRHSPRDEIGRPVLNSNLRVRCGSLRRPCAE